ncbi:hypothetical protein AB5V95_00080 [Metamycoplasma spumans]|uniref:hypothetical protein n=1 Tax=Metamycoplasma spumans TaxID=92406 RepID=UPI0004876E8B
MNEIAIREVFYKMAKEELAKKGIEDENEILKLVEKYFQDIKNIRESNIKDQKAKEHEKFFDL